MLKKIYLGHTNRKREETYWGNKKENLGQIVFGKLSTIVKYKKNSTLYNLSKNSKLVLLKIFNKI